MVCRWGRRAERDVAQCEDEALFVTKQETKRERWFRDGADSFRRVMVQRRDTQRLAEYEGKYPCPLCLDPFLIEAITDGHLTVEHVPPKSVGGAELLLTCAQCNNESGTAFDAEPGKVDLLRSLAQGTHNSAVTAQFTVDRATVNGELFIAGADQPEPSMEYEFSIEPQAGGGIYFAPVAKINDPKNLARFDQALGSVGSTSLAISFSPRIRVDQARASVSWIRAAYLAAFAVFGWRYALRPVFDPLRAQLKAGRAATLPDLHYEEPAADRQRREILVCDEPGQTRCIVVAMGPHVVFLPPLAGGLSLVDVATAVKQGDGAFTGIAAPWPDSPRYELDRLAEQARTT
jgi:hypothetical protein